MIYYILYTDYYYDYKLLHYLPPLLHSLLSIILQCMIVHSFLPCVCVCVCIGFWLLTEEGRSARFNWCIMCRSAGRCRSVRTGCRWSSRTSCLPRPTTPRRARGANTRLYYPRRSPTASHKGPLRGLHVSPSTRSSGGSSDKHMAWTQRLWNSTVRLSRSNKEEDFF